jgi:hypothetical protein
MKNHLFLLIFTLLFFSPQLTAQEKVFVNFNNTHLEKVLKEVEQKFEVIFSYSSEVLNQKKITLTQKDVNIEKILSELRKQTGLLFEKVSNTQIIITKNTQICGYIKDAVSLDLLSDINVFIDDKTYVVTDENGFFSFDNLKTTKGKTLTFNSLGYKIENKKITTQKGCITIFLQPKTSKLDEVVVLGYVTNGIDRNKDGSISVDSKRLGILPGLVSPDIAQSIQLIPGISTLDESATGIQIRGGTPDQNLILYDNIKLYNTGYFYGMFSLFNPFASQKAKIFRSGTSASYGDRISGIIDISSGKTIPKKSEAGVEIDGLAINGYLKKPLSEKVGLYFFARRSYADILPTGTYNSYADKIFTNFGVARDINGNILDLETDDDFTRKTSNNEFHFSDFSTKLIFTPNEKNSISISGLYTSNDLDFDFTGGGEKSADDLSTINKGFSANWSHITNENQQEELTLYYSGYDSFYENDELEDETGNGVLDITKINIRENKIDEVGLHFSLKKQFNDYQKINIGYQLSNTHLVVNVRETKPFETNENKTIFQDINNLKNAFFGEYTYSFKNKGFVNAGLRFVHYNFVARFLIEPRLNFEYPITKRFRLKTAIERRNQPISQLIEFNTTELRLENDLWRLSDNNQFPLLSSNQISGGLLYHHKNLNIDIDAYYKTLEGLTTFTSGFSNPLDVLEQGSSTIKGIDILLKHKWNNYKIWAGYTFNNIEFEFPNLINTTTRFPGNNDITHQFRISNTLKLNNWQFSLGWQIRTGKPITPVTSYEIKIDSDGENAGVVNFGAINSSRLPNFHRLDASVLYDFKIETGKNKFDAQFGFSILNIYDRVQPLDLVYKAEKKPLDDGGIAVTGTTGSSPDELEVILEQVIQRNSLGFTPNVVLRILF